MAELGEIRIFAGWYAPMHWMFCHGQTLSIAENQDLFSLLGGAFGGDGRTTFCLPDLRARIPVGRSETPPPGMTSAYKLGKGGGSYEIVLSEEALPNHTHALMASSQPATTATPSPGVMLATAPAGTTLYSHSSNPTRLPLSPDFHGSAGTGAPHDNVMPSIGVSYIICVRNGSYPYFD